MGLAKGGSSGSLGGIAVSQQFYAEMLTIADGLLKQYGMAASLRDNSTGVLRACTIAITDYSPRDAQTQLANPTERTVLFAAGLGDIPNKAPDWQNEQLVTYVQPGGTVINEILSFSQPLKLYSPAGIVVLYQTNVKL